VCGRKEELCERREGLSGTRGGCAESDDSLLGGGEGNRRGVCGGMCSGGWVGCP
jgi:hypothetical protein